MSNILFLKERSWLCGSHDVCYIIKLRPLFLPRIDLLVDDKYEGPGKPSKTYRPGPDTLVALGKDTFKGCVSNVYLRR